MSSAPLGMARMRVALLAALLVAIQALPCSAESVRVAVATNFAEPVAAIAAGFKAISGHDVVISTGATGALYAQIKAGAPFDMLLAADAERPAAMEREGLGVAGTRFTYAVGTLALWSADSQRIRGNGKAALLAADWRALAMADPALAPYGAAAKQALTKLGLWDRVQGKLVFGKNIGQTHALVATGNAELGFVALSALMTRRGDRALGKVGTLSKGSAWVVPAALHDPINQDAILLTSAAGNGPARDFLAYLRSAEARQVGASFGYGARE